MAGRRLSRKRAATWSRPTLAEARAPTASLASPSTTTNDGPVEYNAVRSADTSATRAADR